MAPPIDAAEIEKRFTHHVPGDKKTPIHTAVRANFKDYAEEMNELLPESREKSLAFTALEEASFWAHAAVARNIEEDVT
jgi:hypothetical protein